MVKSWCEGRKAFVLKGVISKTRRNHRHQTWRYSSGASAGNVQSRALWESRTAGAAPQGWFAASASRLRGSRASSGSCGVRDHLERCGSLTDFHDDQVDYAGDSGFRYRQPWCLSGSGRRDLVSRRTLVISTYRSPLPERARVPSAAMMSPRSQVFTAARVSSDRVLRLT